MRDWSFPRVSNAVMLPCTDRCFITAAMHHRCKSPPIPPPGLITSPFPLLQQLDWGAITVLFLCNPSPLAGAAWCCTSQSALFQLITTVIHRSENMLWFMRRTHTRSAHSHTLTHTLSSVFGLFQSFYFYMFLSSIHPSICKTCFFLKYGFMGVCWSLSPTAIGWMQGNIETEKTLTLTFHPTCMFLDCGG